MPQRDARAEVEAIRARLEQGVAGAGTALAWYGFVSFEDVRFLIDTALRSSQPAGGEGPSEWTEEQQDALSGLVAYVIDTNYGRPSFAVAREVIRELVKDGPRVAALSPPEAERPAAEQPTQGEGEEGQ
jgi:(2Fe-2S) ferredoxin